MLALRASTECALRGRDGERREVRCGTCVRTSPYAGAASTSTSCVEPSDLRTIAQMPSARRAEMASMPEGPATGRVEAKRRAWMPSSTAPA